MSDGNTSYTHTQRLAIFYQRMAATSAAANHDEARAMLDNALNQVENEFSGVPFDERRAGSDGRMYPPSDTFLDTIWSRHGVRCYLQTAHATFIADNGAIEIRKRKFRNLGIVSFEKQGNDGRKVSDYDSSQ